MLEFIGGAVLGSLLTGGGGTTVVNQTPSGPSRVDVHEHKAPTDESIKLLREMEQKAHDQIIGAFVSKSNDLNGIVIHKRYSQYVMEEEVVVAFKLNGYLTQVVHKVPCGYLFTKEEAAKMLYDGLSKEIARTLLLKFYTNEKNP